LELDGGGDVIAEEETVEAARLLWLGSHRIFFARQESHALIMRMRCAWSLCSFVLEPLDAAFVTSRPSRVMIFMPGRWEKSVVGWRDAVFDDFRALSAEADVWEEVEDGVYATLLKSHVGVAGYPLSDDAPESETGLDEADGTGAATRASTW
jgi:hypothetical protein